MRVEAVFAPRRAIGLPDHLEDGPLTATQRLHAMLRPTGTKAERLAAQRNLQVSES